MIIIKRKTVTLLFTLVEKWAIPDQTSTILQQINVTNKQAGIQSGLTQMFKFGS